MVNVVNPEIENKIKACYLFSIGDFKYLFADQKEYIFCVVHFFPLLSHLDSDMNVLVS